jgi:hypothetical protein
MNLTAEIAKAAEKNKMILILCAPRRSQRLNTTCFVIKNFAKKHDVAGVYYG